MSFSPASQTQKFEASRITIKSPKSYDDVLKALYTSIGSPEAVSEFPKIMKGVFEAPNPQEQFVSTVNKTVGPHGFMIMQVFSFLSHVQTHQSHQF
tara:strand:+ start:2409 stop:2696 length:288 start_codon:yes stop_codon:yes gene_type:complete